MEYQFSSANQALDWTANVLRKKLFAQVSSAYRFIEKEVTDLPSESKEYSFLPRNAEDAYDLALDMDKLLRSLDEEHHLLLRMKHWGDFYTVDKMKKAFAEQELLRRKGIRVRVSYQYSNRQMGVLLDCCHKTVQRKLAKAYQQFEELLIKEGYIAEVSYKKSA